MRLWPFSKKQAVIKISDHEPWRTWWGNISGVNVSVDAALAVTTVLSAIRVIAEDVAKLPLVLKRFNDDGSTTVVRDDPRFTLLARRPNAFLTSFQWRETLTLHAALTGNAYCLIMRDASGVPIELTPVMPEWVTVDSGENNEPVYTINDNRGNLIDVTRRDIFHLAGPSWNGAAGMSAVYQARQAIGLSIATERSQQQLHSNGARPGGLLSTEQTLSQQALDNLKSSWKAAHEGVTNAMKTAILDSGLKFQPITMTGVDSQHLETRKYQVEEICRGLKIFPQMVGHSDKTSTYASAEAFFRAHFEHTIWPWLRRWEQCLDRDLLDKNGPLFVEFDSSKFGRGSLKDRAQYYRTMVETGVLTRNEARREEGRDPIPGLDDPLTPLNMREGQEEDTEEPANAI